MSIYSVCDNDQYLLLVNSVSKPQCQEVNWGVSKERCRGEVE